MSDLARLLDVLQFEEVGEGRFRAQNFNTGLGDVVFGGQLLAQAIVAANTVDPTKVLKSVHTIFARGAAIDHPLDIIVDVMHQGRALASATVTFYQGDRLCCRSLALLSSEEPDLIRHGSMPPDVGGPDDAHPSDGDAEYWEIRVVGGIDISDPDKVGPAELFVWIRFPGTNAIGVKGQALLAYATDGFLIGTAMRPHPGIGQSMAHKAFSTSVLSHTLTFHEPVDAGEWHLLAHESPYAGGGRTYGRAHIFTTDGRLVGSFVQDNMIRSFPGGGPPPGGRSSV
jgi:acyl-CoA thioesterase